MLVCGTITLHADENDTKYAQKAVIFSRDRAIFSGETSDPDYNIKYAYSLNDDGERLIRENIFTKSTRMVTVNLILADEIYQIDDYAVLKVERDNNKGGWLTYLYNTGSVYSLCPHTTAIEPVIYENIPCNKVTLTISGSAGDMAAAMGLGALCWRWCVSHAVHRALRGTVFVLVWPLRFAADYAVHPFKQWLLARIRKIRHARRRNAQDSCKKSGKKPKNVLQNKHTILYN